MKVAAQSCQRAAVPCTLSAHSIDRSPMQRTRLAFKSGVHASELRRRRSGRLAQQGAVRTCSSSDTDGLRRQASDFVQTDLYSKYLQGAVFVGVLAAVDAGYSGDWSRIGAISRETEDWLKQVLPLLGTFHALSATVSGVAAGRAGRPWLWPVAKGSLVGGLAMFEQLLRLD